MDGYPATVRLIGSLCIGVGKGNHMGGSGWEVFMYTFYVNGKEGRSEKEGRLLDYLRDELGLTAVKEGCSEGACGPARFWWMGKR